MTPDIALILGIDGIATGSIYVLVGLGLVLIFSVTRVVFVPFGDIVAFSALTLASLQLGRMPGTVYLVATLAVVACIVVEHSSLATRRAATDRARADRLRHFAAAAGGGRLAVRRREPAELGANSARHCARRADRAADRAHCAAAARRCFGAAPADRLGGADLRAVRIWGSCSSARKVSEPSR